MACHHRSRCESVCHAGCKLIDAIATGRVAHQINLVRIDILKQNKILDEPIEERVDVPLVPKVPSIRRSPRRDVDSLVEFVQTLLVFPLAIVDLGRCPAATVHRDVETPTVGWFLPKDCVPKGHLQAIELNTFLLELLASCLSHPSHVVVDQKFLGGLGLFERQSLRRERLVRQRTSNVDGLLQIGF